IKPSARDLEILRQRHLLQAVKESAYTLLNRLVILRLLEQAELSKPALIAGAYNSAAYREYAQFARALCEDPTDDSRGYQSLLARVYQEFASQLPGVFGEVGVSALLPVPGVTLRHVLKVLNDPALDSAWGDDTTLGGVDHVVNDAGRM